MRLLFASTFPYWPDNTNGRETSAHALTLRLQAQGIPVAVFAGTPKPERGQDPRPFITRDETLGYPVFRAKEPLLALAQDLTGKANFDEVFFVSALTGDGVPELKKSLAGLMPEGPWHYPEDQVSDASERLLACEITREQLYRQLHEELPYDSAVRPESYQTRPDGSVEIHQQIVIGRDSQKPIVLGKRGARIKAIGEAARKELAELLGVKVHLFLHVKVEENWAESREIYEEIGLDWVR